VVAVGGLTYSHDSGIEYTFDEAQREVGRFVAVVDDLGHSGMNVPPPSEDFGRQPPQDAAAEQAVLGGMLLSKDAIADVLERLRPGDFYRPAHQNVYDAILDLYGRGEPADAVTVAAELDRRGLLRRIGGAPYLHTLIATVPTAANAGFYAGIVAEKALLRRLVEAGTRVVQYGYAGAEGADVTEIVDRAQAEIYDVTEGRTSEDFVALEDLLQPTMDEIDAIASNGGLARGVPTGFTELDEVTNGLHPGQMIIIAARPGVGKALKVDTPLPTPTGWTTMGDVAVGDWLVGADGEPTRVVAATEVMLDRPCYEVEFSDGTVIVADAEHQWLTEARASRKSAPAAVGYNRYQSQRTFAAVRTTREIAETLRCPTADRRMNHSVVNTAPLQAPDCELLVPPYTLGAWLGDGTTASAQITAADQEILMRIESEGGHKHIPGEYLRASEGQRRALLAGLLDTDGTVTAGGSVQFSVTDRRLADDVAELIVSLGYRCQTSTKAVKGRREDRSTAFTITFATEDEVFGLHRKAMLHKERRAACGTTRSGSRFIVDVRRIDSMPVRCVQVDNASHMYLAGRAMVPTHNSTLGLDFLRSCSIKNRLASVIFSLEMSKSEIVMRLLSAEAKIKLTDMRSGRMSDDDWTRLARRMSEISEAPLYIDDSPNLTMMEIRAKARRLSQKARLKLVVVDYMQLMTSGKKYESRQQEVSDFSRSLKLMAKELDVPVVAISQLNRGPEQRTDKKPMISDLRESGCLTANTRILRADNGAEVTFGELMRTGERPLVWSLDERKRMVARPMTNVFPSGHKEVFKLRLASGRGVEATTNHPFMTFDGWTPLGELKIGDRLAVPRRVPEPVHTQRMDDAEVILLAHMIGDGSCVKNQPIRYASIDEANLAAVTTAAKHFGVSAVRDDYPAARVSTLRLPAPYHVTLRRRNPIAAWLDGLGLFGLRSHEKFVPEGIFRTPNDQAALFLHHLWATDGSVRWDAKLDQARIYYASTSRRLVDDVAMLLLRLGVFPRIKRVRKAGYRDSWHLYVYGAQNQTRFLRDVGVNGEKWFAAREVLAKLEDIVSNTNLDTVPKEVWSRVRTRLSDRKMTHRVFAAAMGTKFCGSTMWKDAPSRSRLHRAAALLNDTEIHGLATNDVFWDEIVEITSIGDHDVYDGTVPGTNNFVAQGISVHNSLEQDADMVILLHRPDAFERDDPRGGEADLILGKHRNGPTKTITVAHQLHLSRFANMAKQ
jgi:replicative DNA helicase